MQSEDELENLKVEVEINQIQTIAEKIGTKYSHIICIYLFGSVARGDAN